MDGVKFSFGLSSIACIGLLLCLRLPDIFGLILLFAFLFGFFGVSSYPLFLELAVEDAYPLDPVISEVEIQCQLDHNFVQGHDAPAWPDLQLCGHPPWQQSLLAGFLFEINRQQLFLFRCSTFNFSFKVEEGRVHSCKDRIAPLDYTPFFYLIMAETTFISVLLPILLNPKLKRSKTDEKD